MAQRRTERKSGLDYGKGGEGKLIKLDGERARLDFNDGQSVAFSVVSGNIFEDENATLPFYVPFKAMKDGSALSVRAVFEKGDTRILFINPSSGEHRVRFVRFQGPEDSPPSWEEKNGTFTRKGNIKSTYREANPFVEVIEGRWKGLQLRGRLFDNFGRDDSDGNTTIYFGKRATSSQNLEDFCNCVGFEYWTAPYSENHLPEIQRVALEKANTFKIMLVSGYISNWIPSQNDEAVFEDVVEPDSAEQLLED